jgi:hypothetical protein
VVVGWSRLPERRFPPHEYALEPPDEGDLMRGHGVQRPRLDDLKDATEALRSLGNCHPGRRSASWHLFIIGPA